MAFGKVGAPKGNKNGAKQNRGWSEVIRRVALRDKKRLARIAEKLLSMAESGDLPALKEFGDRFEGRVPQAIEGTGDDGALTVVIKSQDASVL
jgi:hypothetical protein